MERAEAAGMDAAIYGWPLSDGSRGSVIVEQGVEDFGKFGSIDEADQGFASVGMLKFFDRFALDLSNAFAGDLHQTKLAHGQDGVAGAIGFHGGLQSGEQFVLLFGIAHVDKINDNDASHVAQSYLAGEFIHGFEVHFEHVLFSILLVEGGTA